MEGHAGLVYTLQVLPDGRIVSGHSSGKIIIWSKLEAGEWKQEVLKGHAGGVSTLQVLADGRIVSGGYDGDILIWDGDKV